MDNLEFTRVKLSADHYKYHLNNLNGCEYRYKCDLENNKSLVLRIFIQYNREGNYSSFFFNLQPVNDYSPDSDLFPMNGGGPLLINIMTDSPTDDLENLKYIRLYLTYVFPIFKFEDTIEI